jgi:deoxyribodipyrimidine photo-lyase
LANHYKKTLIVCFGIYEKYPEANERHFAFMLEGLKDVEE